MALAPLAPSIYGNTGLDPGVVVVVVVVAELAPEIIWPHGLQRVRPDLALEIGLSRRRVARVCRLALLVAVAAPEDSPGVVVVVVAQGLGEVGLQRV